MPICKPIMSLVFLGGLLAFPFSDSVAQNFSRAFTGYWVHENGDCDDIEESVTKNGENSFSSGVELGMVVTRQSIRFYETSCNVLSIRVVRSSLEVTARCRGEEDPHIRRLIFDNDGATVIVDNRNRYKKCRDLD